MTSQSDAPTATGHTASFTAAKSDKDEKIAAAKLKVTQFHPFKSTFIPYFKTLKKLKKFKKEKTSQNNETQQTLHVDTAVTSGRSTPSSSYSQPPNNSDTQQKSPNRGSRCRKDRATLQTPADNFEMRSNPGRERRASGSPQGLPPEDRRPGAACPVTARADQQPVGA